MIVLEMHILNRMCVAEESKLKIMMRHTFYYDPAGIPNDKHSKLHKTHIKAMNRNEQQHLRIDE